VKVIFACVHNAGRSQMAAAFYNQLFGSGAISAGTQPAEHVHPEVIQVMKEIGIDLNSAKPQLLTEALARDADLLITMGCGDKCPSIPTARREDWPLPDPQGQSLEKIRSIRDEIKKRVDKLLQIESHCQL
jgi:arsenate reductase